MDNLFSQSAKRLLTVTMGTFLLFTHAHTTPLDESQLKAAFLKNFLGFVHWDSPRLPLEICIQGDRPLYQALQQHETQLRTDHGIEIRWIQLPAKLDSCEALYLSGMNLGEQKRVLGAIQNSPVLTVSDHPGFAKLGGMVELVRRNKRFQFEVNYKSVLAGGLEIEARLLRLASWVHTNTQMAAQ